MDSHTDLKVSDLIDSLHRHWIQYFPVRSSLWGPWQSGRTEILDQASRNRWEVCLAEHRTRLIRLKLEPLRATDRLRLEELDLFCQDEQDKLSRSLPLAEVLAHMQLGCLPFIEGGRQFASKEHQSTRVGIFCRQIAILNEDAELSYDIQNLPLLEECQKILNELQGLPDSLQSELDSEFSRLKSRVSRAGDARRVARSAAAPARGQDLLDQLTMDRLYSEVGQALSEFNELNDYEGAVGLSMEESTLDAMETLLRDIAQELGWSLDRPFQIRPAPQALSRFVPMALFMPYDPWRNGDRSVIFLQDKALDFAKRSQQGHAAVLLTLIHEVLGHGLHWQAIGHDPYLLKMGGLRRDLFCFEGWACWVEDHVSSMLPSLPGLRHEALYQKMRRLALLAAEGADSLSNRRRMAQLLDERMKASPYKQRLLENLNWPRQASMKTYGAGYFATKRVLGDPGTRSGEGCSMASRLNAYLSLGLFHPGRLAELPSIPGGSEEIQHA